MCDALRITYNGLGPMEIVSLFLAGNLLIAIVGTGDVAKRITPLQQLGKVTTYQFVVAIHCVVAFGGRYASVPRWAHSGSRGRAQERFPSETRPRLLNCAAQRPKSALAEACTSHPSRFI